MSWTDFARLVEDELQLAGLPFDRADLIASSNAITASSTTPRTRWFEPSGFARLVRERTEPVQV
jgi:hypothetical protein